MKAPAPASEPFRTKGAAAAAALAVATVALAGPSRVALEASPREVTTKETLPPGMQVSALEIVPEAAPAPASGKTDEPGPAKGLALIKNASLANWDPGIREPWTCSDGIITCNAVEHSGHLNWVEDVDLRGKYELRMQMRIAKHRGERLAIGVFIGDGKREWFGPILEWDKEVSFVHYTKRGNKEVAVGIPRSLDASKWHVWRLVVDDDDIEVHIDGEKVIEYRAPGAIAGKPALFVQRARVEFRNIEVLK